MRQPLWILNSALFLILCVTAWFVFFSAVKLPKRKSLTPEMVAPAEAKAVPKINLETIYEFDLFNTYKAPVIKPIEEEVIEPMPQPPLPIPVQVPEAPAPKFLEPLAVTLTGIIVMQNEGNNIAIIMDNKTKQEINYRVGDEIEDALIIRIFKNKALLVRSNGQQETLYLRQDDAKSENPLQSKNWDLIIQKINSSNYIIDPIAFAKEIKGISNLIDTLNLTTAYKSGESIGTKIGKLNQNSLGLAMGFVPGDIIISINDTPANDTESRFEIYRKISTLKLNDTINVSLLRNNNNVIIDYKLQEIAKKFEKERPIKTEAQQIKRVNVEAEKLKVLEEKHKFAPTLQEIRLRERQNMFKDASKNITTN